MRFSRYLSVALLTPAMLAGCAGSDPGWTYVPAPSLAPAPSSTASAGASVPAGSADANLVSISASGIKFEQTTVTAPAGTPFQIQFENKDAGIPHNVAIHKGDANGAEIFKGEVFPGVATKTYDVPALDAGAYAFACTVHPTMTGTLTAQ
ncbi:MAG: cupredoxin domain-containing protein [Chloroflexota bacterium]